MYDYIEKKGKNVTIYNELGDNEFSTQVLPNTSNIDEFISYEKLYNEKLNILDRLTRKMRILSDNASTGKSRIKLGVVLGVISGLIANAINCSIPVAWSYFAGTLTFGCFALPGIMHICKYYENCDELERVIDNLEDECNYLYQKKLELQRTAKKVVTYEECKVIERPKYHSIPLNNDYNESKDIQMTLKRKLY